MANTVQPKLGHPNGLYVLFFSEMWERFCYYGMRTLLTLYLVKSLMKGDSEASLLYGAYTGLIYAAPILGGRMADNFLGYRYSVLLGAVLMAIGEFLILGGNQHFLLMGMGALIIGNGYFKANISTIVGKLYEDGDPRRDSGFTIFYIGINIGAFLATTVVAFIGETYGFEYGFGLAGIGMLFGFFIFWFGRHRYANAPGLDVPALGKKKIFGPIANLHLITLGSIALIPLCYFLILNNSWLNLIFLGLFIYVAGSLIRAGMKEDIGTNNKVWFHRMIALVIFILINVVFWACFEQAGTSLTLFADRNVDRMVFGWLMPASMTQFFNPLFIIIFGSLFSWMWLRLISIGKNPSIPMKFAFGIFQLGLGFLVTYIGYQFSKESLVPLVFLVLLYLLHTTGELFLSPIGLSMVTKLAPRKMAGTAMGGWFLSFAIANLLGGQIAALTGDGHGPKQEVIKNEISLSTTLEEALFIAGREDQFAAWEEFYSLPSDLKDQRNKKPALRIKKNVEVAKNITLGTFLKIEEWIIVRESIENNESYETWQGKISEIDTASTAKEWLNMERWQDLKQRYKRIIEVDISVDYEKQLGFKDWQYFKSGFGEIEKSNLSSFEDTLLLVKSKVQESRLSKYINIFTIMGFVLIGFSLLLALLSKPLNKLMHGVV